MTAIIEVETGHGLADGIRISMISVGHVLEQRK